MAFSEGEEVYVKQVNLRGIIVSQRLDEDIYLVRFDYRGSSLESDCDSMQADSRRLQLGSQEYLDEMNRLADLVSEGTANTHSSALPPAVIESMTRLGLIVRRS